MNSATDILLQGGDAAGKIEQSGSGSIVAFGGGATAGDGNVLFRGPAAVEFLGSGNNVAVLAAENVNGICYVDADNFTVGSVTVKQLTALTPATTDVMFNGITSAKHVYLSSTNGTVGLNGDIKATLGDIIVDAKNGLITVNSTLDAGTKSVGLWSNVGASDTATGVITANGLQIGGAGNFDLTLGNHTFAVLSMGADTKGSGYAAPASVKVIEADGFSVGDLTLECCTITRSTVGGNVTGIASLEALAGNITQTSALTVGSLEAIAGGGNITLTNTANVLPTVAASATGDIRLTTSGAMSVGSVDGTDGITGGTFVSLSSNGLTQSQAIVAPDGLAVLGSGAAVLGNAGNMIGQYAANTTGSLTINETAAVTLGSAGGTAGVTVGSSLTINATGQNISQTAAVVAPTATLNNGSGNVALTNAANNFGTVSAPTTGKLELADANNISVTDVAGSSVGVAAGGDVTITSPGSVNMGVISGQKISITAAQNITDANGQDNNITASVDTTLVATGGTVVTVPARDPFRGVNTPTLYAFGGGTTATTNDGAASVDVWGQVGNDTIVVIGNPPGSVWLNGRRIGVEPVGIIANALQSDLNSIGTVALNAPLGRADIQNELTYSTNSPRVTAENSPAPGVGPSPSMFVIGGPGQLLPSGVSQQPGGGLNVPGVVGVTGVPAQTGQAGQVGQVGQVGGSSPIMVLQPGSSVNVNGNMVVMSANGDVLITLSSAVSGAGAGAGGLSGLSSITITPTDSGFEATGRVASGGFSGLEGGVAGNTQLKALLDQIADFLPEEYRRKWGLRAKGSDASGIKVSQL